MLSSFSFKPMPTLIFGPGRLAELPRLIAGFGSRILVVLGSSSFRAGRPWQQLQDALIKNGCTFELEQISGEPSPESIDTIVSRHADHNIELVVAIGGGSVVDGGKAVSAMLAEGGTVTRLLEGVGSDTPTGNKIPFIAVPTTAGTGSEASSNAVISNVGVSGFKKSLRHDNYIPNIALVDPELTLSCPEQLTVNCVMDTFTQLVEAYLSTHGSPLTDALALEGIRAVQRSLGTACSNGSDIAARADISYAAYLSGVVLTNAGLGIIHGFASTIGGFFHIPHGVVCGTLMAASNERTLARLRSTGENPAALDKYSVLGRLFSNHGKKTDTYYQDAFITELTRLTEELGIPCLSDFGIAKTDIDRIVRLSGNKYNPVNLDDSDMASILRQRLHP